MALAVTHSKTLVAPDSGVEDKVYGSDYVSATSHTITGAGALASLNTVGTAQIDAAAVAYANIQNVSAADKVLGRSSALAGVVEEIACTAAGRALIDDADAAAQRTTLGLGTLATQSGTFSGTSSGTNTGDQTITLTGNVTGTGAGSFAATIAAAAVTLAKMENRATQTFVGRNTAGAGVPEELSAATAKTMLALTGTNSGDQTITLTTDVTGSGTGSFAATIAANAVTDAKFRQGGARSVVGVTGNATSNTADIVGTTDQVLRVSGAGTALAFGAIDLSKVAAATGVLQAASFPAMTGNVTSVAGALATTIAAGVVTRAMQAADGKNWTFLGQATASNAVRTGTITWAGTWKQLWFEYFISGYNGTGIGRLIVGPTAGLSETATNHCTNLIEGVTQNITSVSVPGWPTAVTTTAARRWGWMKVKNVASEVKSMTGIGNHTGTAATAVPIAMKMDGLMSDATNLINKAELAVYAAITGAAISAQTFNAGTYLNVWGRNDD